MIKKNIFVHANAKIIHAFRITFLFFDFADYPHRFYYDFQLFFVRILIKIFAGNVPRLV